MRSRFVVGRAALAVGLVATVSLGVPARASRPVATVVAVANKYAPADVTIAFGTTLKLVNLDRAAHNVVALNGSFHSDTLGGPAVMAVPVEALPPGIYQFYCSVHEQMVGTLHVT